MKLLGKLVMLLLAAGAVIFGLADQGAHLNGVPLLHHRRAGRADVLLHGKDHLGGNGHFDRFHPGSSLLMRDAGAQRRAL